MTHPRRSIRRPQDNLQAPAGRNHENAKAIAKSAAKWVARQPLGWYLVYWTWSLKRKLGLHPIDATYGIRTTQELPPYLIAPHARAQDEIQTYAGCHPNCVRRAISKLPSIASSTFLDLGCGRGRALIIASEYPFRAILGVELSPDLVRHARRNVATVVAQYPDRPSITIAEGDATEIKLPDGPLVVFTYHSLGPKTFRRLIAKLEAAIYHGQDVTLIYENPIHGHFVDASKAFRRLHGEQIACELNERPYHPDPDDAIVMWCPAVRPADVLSEDNTDFDIKIVTADHRAEVVPRIGSRAEPRSEHLGPSGL